MALKSKQKLSTKIQIEEDNSEEEMEIIPWSWSKPLFLSASLLLRKTPDNGLSTIF